MACGILPFARCVKWRFHCANTLPLVFFLLYFNHNVSGHIRYSIPEEMKKGSLIGNVAQDLGLDLKRLRSGRGRIVTGENIQYIELKTDKGILVVNERIDREQLCGDITPCSFSFEVILENPMELHQITVEITDINDHWPTFERNRIHFEISESSNNGARFPLPSAEDPDVGVNGLREYFLTENDNFVLKQNSNADGKKYAEMVLQKPLDRETHPSLSLKLIAVDGGTPQRSGTVNIDITVLDANDNNPVFNQSVYKGTVMENAPRDTYVTTVNASDADIGSNSVVSYYFSDLNSGLSNLFTINEKTGIITITGSIDYEKDKKYELRIEAKDQGGLTDFTKVIIEVMDVNDNAPVISVMSFTSPVSEDSPPGTTIGIINVKDADSGDNGQITCKIEQNAPFQIKSTLRNYYSLVTDTVLDRERPERQPSQVLYPVQTGGSHVAEMVPRSADVGYLVTKVVAVDVDSGQNAWLSYKLHKATDRALFEVGLQNGEIRTIRQVTDKDAVKQRLTVIVEDNGQPSRSATVIVNVAVADSFPEVLSEFTDFAHDKEYNDNLTFYLVLALAVVSFLFVTCLVVIISVKIYRWRQSRVLYHSSLPVIPYYPPRYSDTLGTGTLQHVYNYEVCRTTDSRKSDCKLGRAGSQNVLIMDPSSTGTMQRIHNEKSILDEPDSPLEMSAKDPDENQNARISYILDVNNVGGSSISDYISVSADSGVIHAVRSFDYEQIKQIVFVVKAQDGGSPPLSSNVTVKILIQDQNDNPPQVLYPVQTGGSHVAEMVPRSADVGYLVTKVVAVDVDSGQNAWLSYKLHKATDRALFEVGLQNGEIRTIRQVTDKDAVKQRLTVIVEDNGQPSRSATVIVNVAVADSFPEVLSEFTDFAHDKEYNDNLTFYLVLALAVVSFLFITCLVVIISVKIYRWRQSRILYHSSLPVIPYYPPRYSDTLGTGTLQHVYNYEVCRTTDSRKSDCKLGRAGSQNVLIMDPSSTGTMQRIHNEKSILDEPDSPLEIRYSVPEEMKKGFLVGNVAQDLGLDLKRLRSGRARIVTGENVHYTELKTDKGILVDQNDNPPQVLYPVQTGGSYVAEMVPRSADVGYLVTKVVAVDVDSGQNAWLSYKLHKATDRALFEVGLQNGEIRTIRQVTDKDAVKQRLTVIVEDNGQPSRSATVIVNVAVADSFPEVLSEFTDFAHDKEYNDNLTFYLVLALAVVSFLFITCLVVIISVKIYRWRQSRILYHSSLPVIPYYPPRYSDTLGTGTLQHVYNYEVCRTTDSRKSDCKLGRAGSQNVLIMDPSSTGTMQRIHNEKSILDEPDSPLEDQNDNPPQVLYPVQTGGSHVAEMVPRSADVGYLVTKVVAVDVDSGQNAWLSYKLHKATDRALFEVGLQNGEIRTIRQVTDKDAVKQRLTVIVEDNGQPSRSATVIVNVAVADSFPEVLSEFTDFAHDKEYNDNLTFYLVLALAVVSFLFITCLVVIISVKIYRWRQSRILYHSSLPVIPYYPPRYSDTLGTGTLQHVYNYEVCRTTDSRKSDMKCMQTMSQSLVSVDGAGIDTPQVEKHLSGDCSQMSTLVSDILSFPFNIFSLFSNILLRANVRASAQVFL
ncbi:hypothetical protein Q5P01_008958 [Channa striata]|uniref:Cadherin domain-containing protein n=1 Tax=Channa striata TaxID=64152 RepID=A0AA88SWY3_CHASR|nr:hypothetical protein Q5P01_008958 [Channa striata]